MRRVRGTTGRPIGARASSEGVARGRPRIGADLAIGAVVLSLSACGFGSTQLDSGASPTAPSSTPPDPKPEIRIVATGAGTFEQLGSAGVSMHWVSVEGGRARLVSGDGGDEVIRFPRFAPTGRYPRAVLRVDLHGAPDPLSPGLRNFSWGAEVRLDRTSQGRKEDNGNNVIERGLYDEEAFFKAELDGGKPGCTVRGSDGIVVLHSPHHLKPGAWYRLRCQRDGDYVTLTVTRSDGTGPTITAVRNGALGPVTFDPAIPIAIGGKLAPDGSMIKSATDQFNGEIANPFVDLQ